MQQPQERKIYLASKSPRRRELLRQIGVDFELLLLSPQNADNLEVVSEDVNPGELPVDYVKRISREKACFAWGLLERRRLLPRPVLSADTTVVLNGNILGKPANADEAFNMLKNLSGQTHHVLTSMAIKKRNQLFEGFQESEVTFGILSDDSIRAYCATLEPYDKAGGYGIQGLAAKFIKHISGSYSGIMGLPLYETTLLLREAGIAIP